jgi:hypothetical protein
VFKAPKLKKTNLIAVNTFLKEYLDYGWRIQDLNDQVLAGQPAGAEPPIKLLAMVYCVYNDLMPTLESWELTIAINKVTDDILSGYL